MNGYRFLLVASVFSLFAVSSCQENGSESKEEKLVETVDQIPEYRKLPPYVQFYIPEGERIKGDSIRAQEAFVEASGLPLSRTVKNWMQGDSASRAKEMYESYVQSNKDHRYMDFYRQYAGWVLISRTGLLERDDTAALQFTKQLLYDMLESKYIGFGLVYFTANHLRENDMLTDDELSELKSLVKNNRKYLPKQTPEQHLQKPLPPVAGVPSDFDENIRRANQDQERYYEMIMKL